MGSVSVFIHITLDGFFAGPRGEIDWFKSIQKDDAYEAYTHEQAAGGSTLLFGRTTYEMMKSYWPTPGAAENDPQMAKVMNESAKIVFSRTLQRVEEEGNWKNVALRRQIDRADILERKAQGNLTILGSGSIVQQFANLGLIDEYQLIVVPIVLGAGKHLFEDVRDTPMRLDNARSFANGVVALKYGPAAMASR